MAGHPILRALQGIGEGLDLVRRRSGHVEKIEPWMFGEEGLLESPEFGFLPETPNEERHRVTVEEGLIGAALALAQTHLDDKGKGGRTPTQWNLWHVANYWKHRNGSGLRAPTVEAIFRLGGKEPLTPAKPGDLRAYTEAALGCPFDIQALWNAVQ